ncbi:hypothetical protein ABE205_20360, partial [Brevibacillus agri]
NATLVISHSCLFFDCVTISSDIIWLFTAYHFFAVIAGFNMSKHCVRTSFAYFEKLTIKPLLLALPKSSPLERYPNSSLSGPWNTDS